MARVQEKGFDGAQLVVSLVKPKSWKATKDGPRVKIPGKAFIFLGLIVIKVVGYAHIDISYTLFTASRVSVISRGCLTAST